jgi:DNA-binding transcriptional LysR family regulator
MEERLQKFVKLVEAGSFTKAAEIMHISQPALTVAIAKLERELGAQLLVRDTRPLELTEAGRVAYEAGIAQGVVLDNLHTELSDLAGRRLSVRIGLVDSVAATLFAHSAPLAELEKQADVSVIVNDSHHLQRAVDERALDVAVVVADDARQSSSERLANELMVLVCAPHVAAIQQAKLTAGQLTDFISYDQPSRTAEVIEKSLQKKGVMITSRLQSSSPEVMCRMVVSGTGVAVLPYVVVRSMLVTKALAVLTKDGNPVTVVRGLDLSQLPGKRQAQTVEYFIRDMKAALVASYDEAVSAIAKIKP